MRSHRVHSKKAEDLSKASHTPPRARVSAAAAPSLRNFALKKYYSPERLYPKVVQKCSKLLLLRGIPEGFTIGENRDFSFLIRAKNQTACLLKPF